MKRDDPHISLRKAADTRAAAGWEFGVRFVLGTFRGATSFRAGGQRGETTQNWRGAETLDRPYEKERCIRASSGLRRGLAAGTSIQGFSPPAKQ